MTACGCLACAFLFGSGNKEARRERDIQEILKLFEDADDSEAKGDSVKALELYAKAQDKTHAFDKAYPKEDPTTMQLIRTRCTIQIENIRFNLAKQTNESPIAVTPAEEEGEAEPATTRPSYTVPSRTLDGTTRPPQQSVNTIVAVERVVPTITTGPANNRGNLSRPETPAAAEPAMSVQNQVEWARDRIELGQPEQALEDLRAVLVVDPDHTGARFLFALASLQCGDVDSAGAFLADLELDAPSEAVHLLAGAVHFQNNDPNAALAAIRKARVLNPKSAAAFYNEAVVLLEIPGTPREFAVTAYRQALLLGAGRDPALEARLDQP